MCTINRIYTICYKITGCCSPATSLEQLHKSKLRQMTVKILSDPTHFLHDHYDLLHTGRRYRIPTVKTQRAHKSFMPSSNKYLNQPQNINRWPTYHSAYRCHCNVVLSHLFFDLIILSYCLAYLFQYLITATVYTFIYLILLCICITMLFTYCFLCILQSAKCISIL